MNIYFDTEFTGLHKNTTLISIGLISEDGKTFYAEFTDYDKRQCDTWINENVISHLSLDIIGVHKDSWKDSKIKGNKSLIKFYLSMWLSQFENVQLISDVCHYDMMLFVDIFGSAWDLPKNVNPSCHDINQDIAEWCGITEKQAFDMSREEILNSCEKIIEGDKHNALYDAKIIKGIYEEVIK
jgi:hypothetical protein